MSNPEKSLREMAIEQDHELAAAWKLYEARQAEMNRYQNQCCATLRNGGLPAGIGAYAAQEAKSDREHLGSMDEDWADMLAKRRDEDRMAADVGTVSATLAERGARYGDFTDHACIAQQLQDVMRREPETHFSRPGWDRLSAVQRQALTVIADKIARILNGDPNYPDNWHDIQGYAKLAEDRCGR